MKNLGARWGGGGGGGWSIYGDCILVFWCEGGGMSSFFLGCWLIIPSHRSKGGTEMDTQTIGAQGLRGDFKLLCQRGESLHKEGETS